MTYDRGYFLYGDDSYSQRLVLRIKEGFGIKGNDSCVWIYLPAKRREAKGVSRRIDPNNRKVTFVDLATGVQSHPFYEILAMHGGDVGDRKPEIVHGGRLDSGVVLKIPICFGEKLQVDAADIEVLW